MIYKPLLYYSVLVFLGAFMCAGSPPDPETIVQQSQQMAQWQSNQMADWRSYLERDGREMENYDVHFYHIDLDLDFTNSYISGSCDIALEILEDDTDTIVLDLTNNLQISRVELAGVEVNYQHLNHQIQIPLDTPVNAGDDLLLQIYYSGNPVMPDRYGWGLVFTTHAGTDIAFSLVEPYASRDWWPCKDVPLDKADSVHISITCPDNFTAVANGLLTQQEDNGNGTATWYWRENYPISTYLVSIAVTNYQLFSQEYTVGDHQFNIDHYLFPEQYDSGVELFDITPEMLDFLQTIYGDYPFALEKYGHAVYPGSGAMEHQTCTSFGSALVSSQAEYVVLHELAHQWAGDLITCGTWSHIWLNEGFAEYSETLWSEYLYGFDYYLYHMDELDSGGSIDDCLYREPGAPGGEVLDWVVYAKGAWTLHMLRGVVGDEVFFQILEAYMATPELRYGTAVTADLQAVAEEVSGEDLAWFFDQWLYKVGRPVYDFAQYSGADSCQITLNSAGSFVEAFSMPVQWQMGELSGTAWTEGGINHLTLPMADPPADLVFDPDNWVLDYGYTRHTPVLRGDRSDRDPAVVLHWDPWFDSGYAGMQVYRHEGDGNFIQITNQPITASSFEDTDVEPDITYSYVIAAAWDAEGTYLTDFSNEVVSEPVDYTFDQGILIVDQTRDNSESSPFPTDEQVDEFYEGMIPWGIPFATWDVATEGMPPLGEMAHYSGIIWHNDDTNLIPMAGHTNAVGSYLDAGGYLALSSWKNLDQVPESFRRNYLHIEELEYNSSSDFIGAFGDGCISYVAGDTTKIPTNVWDNKLRYVNHFVPSEDAMAIYYYDSATDDPEWEGVPVAIHTTNTPHRVWVTGFPLYFMETDVIPGFLTALGFEPPVFGDIVVDDEIDILDIVLLVTITMGEYDPSEAEILAGDNNCDGVIDILDIVRLISIIIVGW